MKQWNPQAIKDALDLESQVDGPYEPLELTQKKVNEAAPLAIESIIYLATYSESESLRFNAAKYLLDRALGKIGDNKNVGKTSDTLSELVNAVVRTNSAN